MILNTRNTDFSLRDFALLHALGSALPCFSVRNNIHVVICRDENNFAESTTSGGKLESSNNSHHCIAITYIVKHFDDWEPNTTARTHNTLQLICILKILRNLRHDRTQI